MIPETVTPDERASLNKGQLFMGALLILVGAAFLLDQMRMIEVGHVWRYWPFLIIAMGVKKLLDNQPAGRPRRGWFMVLLGTLLALDEFRILRMQQTWPLFVVAFGVGMIRKSLGRPSRAGEPS